LTLTPAQVDELMASLEEKAQERNSKHREAAADGSWHRKRTRGLQRQLKRWTGSVTAEQKVLLQQTAEQLEPTVGDWLDSQRQWRTSMREALTQPRSVETHERIGQLLREPDSEWTAEYEAKSDRNRERILSMLQTLDASLTSPQRERLQRELRELAEQLEAMMED
jgi:DNA-binding FadR family transcriptional regulator